MKCEVFQSNDDLFAFRIKAKNGAIVSGGETYTRSHGAVMGLKRALKRILESDCIVKKAKNGEFYWLVLGRNGQVLAWTTETHKKEAYAKSSYTRLKTQIITGTHQEKGIEIKKTYDRRKRAEIVHLDASMFA